MINYLLSKFKRARQNSAEAKAQSAFYSALVKFIEDSGERVSMSDIYAREEFKRIPRAQSVRMSKYLYDTNEFAQGMIERYVKKIVGTGFLCSPTPCGDLINCTPQELEVFATYAESAFLAYCNTPESVSWRANRTLGEIQRTILRESLIYGDVLVLITYGSDGFPKTEIIRGDRIQTPHYYIDNPLIKEGVLINPDTQKPEKFFVKGDINNLSGNSEPVFYEIEAYTKTGRRQAILFKSNDDHSEGIRGDPFLSINMRTLSEINTSLAAEQRAMLINSLLVMTQTRGPDETEAQANTVQDALLEGLSNLSAIGKKVISNEPKPPTRRTDANAYDISEPRKGLLITGMPHGSDIKSHNSSRPNLNVANFIAECVKTACRAKSMPPEVYLMEYNSSFGASQAAKADFFEIQRLEASRIVADVCTPLYREFLLSLVSASRVSMPGYIEAIRDLIGVLDCIVV